MHRTHRARPRPRPWAPAPLLAALVAALLALGACSSSDGSEPSTVGAVDEEVARDMADTEGEAADGGSEEAGGAAPEDPGGDGAAGRPATAEGTQALAQAPQGRMISRDAVVVLVVPDVLEASSRTRAAALAVDGYVVSEEVSPATPDRPSSGHAVLVLSVPSADLDAVLAQVSAVGAVRSTRLTSEDVTEQVVDTEARIATHRASIDRVRALLGEAADLEDVVALERELSSREAELDALLAVQQSLRADVSRSGVTVELSTDRDAPPVVAEPGQGFLAGLARGWEAFGSALTVALTAAGMALPFVALAALLVLPLLALRSRSRRRGSAPARPLA